MADGGAAQVVYDVLKSLVSGWLWPRFKCHLDYWRRFRRNVEGLRDEIGRLETERRDMDRKVEAARLRAETPTTEVQAWKIDGDQKLEQAAEILRGCQGLKAWKIISRYSWGKKAKKTADKIAQFRDGAKEVIRISDPAPVPARAPIPHEPAMKFDSRRCVEEDMMKFLTDENVPVVAICGGGGIGKTTMVQRIEDRVREEKLFDEVVHVVVSQQIDMLKIQKEIAELLRLQFTEDTLVGRAHKLHARLLDSKRKLIVFDDVWEYFKLGDIGVPLGNGSKIILTSRVKDACTRMGAEKIIQMEVLTEEESWDLFKEKAGSRVEDPDLLPIAKDVAAECKGLPIALVNVGKTLQDRSIHVWKDSLSQLRRCMPIDIPHVLKDVYMPLKLSYDFLENERVKSLFLLCCMFPEDYDIPIEHLTLYGIGLDMFEGIKNIDEGRDKTHTFVEELKSRFLLLDGEKSNEVKMHDVVRDMAIYIGSKEKYGFLKCPEVSSRDLSSNCNWMSIDMSIENAKLPFGSGFPKLRLMMIENSNSSDANGICFKGMECLNVLSFSGTDIQSFPPTLKLLKKLTTLQLHNCTVKDISLVGELPSLEILQIEFCGNIEELSTNIGRLNRLRSLAIYQCPKLKKIAAGVISSLVGLEELKIYGSFHKWEGNGNQSQETNARLSELGSLPNLTCLEIEISDYNLFSQDICLSQPLARFNMHCIRNHNETNWNSTSYDFFLNKKGYERRINLSLEGNVTAGNWVHQLVRSTQSLSLEGDGSNNINLAETGCMRDLFIKDCSTVKKLVNAAVDDKFPVLVSLWLEYLSEFEEMIEGAIPKGSNSFQNLKSLVVQFLPKLACLLSPNQNVTLGNLQSISTSNCANLCRLFSMEVARSLVKLTSLSIIYCAKIEQVLWNNEMEISNTAMFPSLKHLELRNLPNLSSFSEGVETIESLHRLTSLTIVDCPKLMITKIGKYPNLRRLEFSNFHAPNHLLLCSQQMIETLSIKRCESIEEILWDELGEGGHIIFSELKELTLSNLPCFTTFCRDTVESIKFPKLKSMVIDDCPKLKSLVAMDPTSDNHSLHFFCDQKIEILGLETLFLDNLQVTISKIWCCHIPINFFHTLLELYISNVNGISNLISALIAENLVNLNCLSIYGCDDMVDAIEDETEVSSMPLFPYLEMIYLGNSHKLRSFCQWKRDLEFPSLKHVEIYDCAGMETFSLGSLITPSLSTFKIDDKEVETKDLNGIICDQFRIKTENKDGVGKKAEDEEKE